MKTDGTGRLTEFALTMIGIVGDNSAGHAKGIELFRSKDSVVFADIYAGGIRQTWQIRTKQFSHWLANIYFESAHSFPTQGQLKAIINQIEAQAQIDTPEREVFLRLGELGDRLYLDLVDKSWAAVEIDATGWRVVQQPQVRFVRAAGMLPLPVPERGGSIETLRWLVNVADEQDFVLVVAWLLAALHHDIPKPVIAIRGGAGSAKSSLVEILRGLIDPHDPPYTAFPQTELKLRAAAAASYLQAYDNVSGLTASMSDGLCRFVTDGSNQPVIINGMSDIIARPDLADRSLVIDCVPISDAQRRTHADLMTTFASAQPQILGVLLDAVAHGLRNRDQTETLGLPRMADFAQAVAACETMFWPASTFRTAYDLNRAEVVEALIEADPVASAVRLMTANRQFWEGQASDLDDLLRAITGNLTGAKNWPADPRILANTLRHLAPSLLKNGIDVRFHRARDRDRKRLITITVIGPDVKIHEQTFSASAASENPASGHEENHNDAGGHDSASASPGTPSNHPTTNETLTQTADGADAGEVKQSLVLKATAPKVPPRAADAGIKGTNVEFVRYIPGTRVPVLRYRTPSKLKRPNKSLKHTMAESCALAHGQLTPE